MTSWCALVPQKALHAAKGRLALPPDDRRAVATAMLLDTVAALESTAAVARVIMLWDDDEDRDILPAVASLSTRGHGLNQSLEIGAERARCEFPGLALVVVPGDLPSLDAADLALCLERASRFCRAYLPDLAATGTTLLTATEDFPLLPAYGASSAANHAASGAYPLNVTGLDSLRADVDDLKSLARAMMLGAGHHTLATCASHGLAPEVAR